MNLLIGQDTELFLKKDNSFISAYGVIPGSKQNPYPVKKGAVQVDGMALEFNTLPAKTFDQFRNNINIVLSRLQDMIPNDYEIAICPTAHFDSNYLNNQPNEAKMLGCDPDFNAYTGMENEPPEQHPTLRTASGHIHLGWTNNEDVCDPRHINKCCHLVKQLDIFLGLPSLFCDKNIERKQMYGKAGSFRPKPYGVEYRVLSNYWILNEQYMKDVYEGSHFIFNGIQNGKDWHKEVSTDSINIERIINQNDTGMASGICNWLGIPIRS